MIQIKKLWNKFQNCKLKLIPFYFIIFKTLFKNKNYTFSDNAYRFRHQIWFIVQNVEHFQQWQLARF